MTAAAQLRDNVHRLARSHAATIQTDSGPAVVKADSLISQLRQAIRPSTCGGTGGSPTKQRLAMDAGAFDAYQIVNEQARRALLQCSRKPRKRSLEGTVIAYQAAIQAFGEGEIAAARDITGQWVKIIENTLTPPRARRATQQPCPACGALWDHTLQDRRWAVTVWAGSDIPMHEWEAYCSACESEWVGDNLAYYLRAAIPLQERVFHPLTADEKQVV